MAFGPDRRALFALATAALSFQVFHLAEHTVQLAMWVRHPQRGPWMSPWANALAVRLGRVDPGRLAETTVSVARGVEYLHLVGNLVFLGGVVALWLLARPHPAARSSARRALIIQSLHVVEHVVLVSSFLLAGRPIGLSTLFGLIDGTRLTTSRVWWHGGVNLLATAVCVQAVLALRSAYSQRRTPSQRPLARPVMAALSVPLILAFAVGEPLGAAENTQPGGSETAAVEASGRDGFRLVDVAASVGLDVRHSAFRWDVTMDPVAMMGAGVCWIDVDRDGWLDLFVTDTWSDGEWGLWNAAGPLPTTRIFRNVERAASRNTPMRGRLVSPRGPMAVWRQTSMATVSVDLYVTTAPRKPPALERQRHGIRRGRSDGRRAAYGWHTGAAAGDIDGDGSIDLVVAGYADLNNPQSDATTGFPNTFAPVPDLVYLNRGTDETGRARFDEVATTLGIEPVGPEYGLGVVLADLDADGDLDLYVANDTQPNRLYRNDSDAGRAALSDVSARSRSDDANSGMGIAVGDTNGDARPDVLVTNLEGQGHASIADERRRHAGGSGVRCVPRGTPRSWVTGHRLGDVVRRPGSRRSTRCTGGQRRHTDHVTHRFGRRSHLLQWSERRRRPTVHRHLDRGRSRSPGPAGTGVPWPWPTTTTTGMWTLS